MFRFRLILTAFVLATASARADEATDRLAAAAKGVLEKNCSRCHANGQAEGGFGFVLDARQLIERNKVIPGNSAKSRFFKKVRAGEMPPEDEKPRPSADELATLQRWIDAGASSFALAPRQRPFLPQESVLAVVRDHLRNLPAPSGQPFQRYFALTHLHNNPTVSDEDLRWQRAALSKAINSLSLKPGIVVPRALDPEQTIFAVDLRDLDWDRRQIWEEVAKFYPYGLKLDGHKDEQARSVASEVYRLSGTDLPIFRADWFVATATRPPLYHTILDLPDTDTKLEQSLRLDAREDFLRDKVARSGFAKSGVSSQNRLIERHEAAHGAYWKSYDFRSNDGTGNLLQFPLGPVFPDNPFADQAFVQAGGELIFHLPNGLQGYLLVDGKGKRINEGPTEVVSDTNKSSGTVAIVTGLSCMVCHKHGMIRDGFKDELRQGVGVAGAARDKVQRLHRASADFSVLMKDDEDRFLAALDRAVGPFLEVGPDKDRNIRDFTDEPIGRVARVYHRDLTLQDVAAELGLANIEVLSKSIAGNNRLRELGLGVLSNGGTLKRDAWSSVQQRLSPFQRVALELDLGSPHLPF
jgi:serine/threonine-protein kinase